MLADTDEMYAEGTLCEGDVLSSTVLIRCSKFQDDSDKPPALGGGVRPGQCGPVGAAVLPGAGGGAHPGCHHQVCAKQREGWSNGGHSPGLR